MLASFGILITFTQSEIDHVADITLVAVAHKEIVWFHVAVDEVVGVHILEAGDHLISQHAHGLQSELTAAVLEQIFERMAEELHDHGLVIAFNSVPLNFGNTFYAAEKKKSVNLIEKFGVNKQLTATAEQAIKLILILELWELCS